MMLVGVSRNGQVPGQSLRDLRAEAGDAAVIEFNDSFFYENRRETDFAITKPLEGYYVKRANRAVMATRHGDHGRARCIGCDYHVERCSIS
jgi:hypothetical protein